MDLMRKSNPDLKPYIEKKRFPCPFYGIDVRFGMATEGGEHQCVFMEKSYLSCKMHIRGEKPDWNKCKFNTEENKNRLVGILANLKIFPKEFEPPEPRNWRGIDFAEWVDYVLRVK